MQKPMTFELTMKLKFYIYLINSISPNPIIILYNHTINIFNIRKIVWFSYYNHLMALKGNFHEKLKL